MKRQRNYLKRTQHFLWRAWQRGFYYSSIEKLTRKLNAVKTKTFYLVSRKKLKELKVSKIHSKYLVIVVKEDCLVTLFEIDDLWTFMKANSRYQFRIIK